MGQPISPLREGDLPPREKSFWKMTGPGALMVGLSIGSGELILWPWIVAKFGAGMAWAPALAIFLQLWVNVEIGRWAIASGESAITGFARASKVTVYYFMTLLFMAALLPGWARASGTAFRFLFFGLDGPGADWIWTAFVYGLVAIVLFGPKRIYSGVELCVSLLVLTIFIGLVVVVFQVGTPADVTTLRPFHTLG